MKTRNIITIISVVFALVSCSADSDILNEVSQPVEAGMEAVISCSINNVMTKSTLEADKAINSVVYFLLDKNGDVLAHRTGTNTSFSAKSQAGLEVLAVANASTDVTTLASKDAIMNRAVNESDLNNLIKVGCQSVAFIGTSATVKVVVSQVAARIDLSQLTVTIADADVVTLESVELINQNTNGIMNGTVAAFSGQTVTAANLDKELTTGTIKNVCNFYSFANNSDKATALKLNFVIDGKAVSTSVAIKDATGGAERVVSGANHQLNLTVAIQGENVTPEVSFTVADWNKSEISVDMTDK